MMNALPCPFCGEHPIVRTNPLWRGDHGYPYEFEMLIGCPKCGYNFPSVTTLYNSNCNELEQILIDKWNTRRDNG